MTSKHFQKKPVTVAATQWFKNGDHPQDDVFRPFEDSGKVPTEPREGLVVRYFRSPTRPGIAVCKHCDKTMHHHGWIDTREGGHIVCPGDWIITGVDGEMYPCKPAIFQKTYVEVDEKNDDQPDRLGWEMVEPARVNARYWEGAARNETERESALQHLHQAMLAYKNCAYHLAEQIAARSTSQMVPLLDRIKKVLEAASDERYKELKHWEGLAWKWKNEGDMYGCNFHQGMAAGANWCDIFYRRIGREIDVIKKELSVAPDGTANKP